MRDEQQLNSANETKRVNESAPTTNYSDAIRDHLFKSDDGPELDASSSQIDISPELYKSLHKGFSGLKHPGEVFRRLTKSPEIVKSMHGMGHERVLGHLEWLDHQAGADKKSKQRKAAVPEIERAVADGDFTSFQRAANDRDISNRQRGYRGASSHTPAYESRKG